MKKEIFYELIYDGDIFGTSIEYFSKYKDAKKVKKENKNMCKIIKHTCEYM